jgi:hypothetical protein
LVEDLPVLVDCPVDVPPDTVDLDVGLVDEPSVTDGVTGRAGGIDQFRGEPLDPAERGHVIDVDAALGEELLQVPVRQALAQVPADRQEDHIRGNRNPAKAEGACLRLRPGRRGPLLVEEHPHQRCLRGRRDALLTKPLGDRLASTMDVACVLRLKEESANRS